jgi:hypothetical protein
MCVCFVCKFFAFEMKFDMLLIFSKLPQSERMHGTPTFQSRFEINLHATHIPTPPKCGKKSIFNLPQNYQNRRTQYMPQFCYKVQGLSKCCLKCMSLRPKDMSNGQGITCWNFWKSILPLLLFPLLAMGCLWLVHHYLLPLLYYMGPTCTCSHVMTT